MMLISSRISTALKTQKPNEFRFPQFKFWLFVKNWSALILIVLMLLISILASTSWLNYANEKYRTKREPYNQP